MDAARINKYLRRMKAAYAMLFIALAATIFIFYRVREDITVKDRARFDGIVEDSRKEVERGISRGVDQLYNVRAFFAGSEDVGWSEWQAYLGSMSVRHNELGIRSVGYIEKVLPESRDAFLNQRRADTKIHFDISPAGDREVYYPLVYVTHFDASAAIVFGLDHGARPERLSVINEAIDQNQPLATERTRFMSSDGIHTNSGVFVYLPIYENGWAVGDLNQRRVAVRGLVYITFVPETMLSVLFTNQTKLHVGLEIYDGQEADSAKLMYGSTDSKTRAAFTRQMTIPVLNRQWTILFYSQPDFSSDYPHYLSWITLSAGVIMSFMLFAFARTRVKVDERIERGDTDLQESKTALAAEKERLAVTLCFVTDGVITTDSLGKVVSLNRPAEQLTGWTQKEAEGRPVRDVFRCEQEETGEARANPAERALATGLAVESLSGVLLLERNGIEHIIADSVSPIRQNGKIVGAVLVFRETVVKHKSDQIYE